MKTFVVRFGQMTLMYYLCIREIKYYLNHINKMDNNNQNQEGQQLQIDLSPEVAKGVYTNFQIISHSSSEFVLDFATLLPGVPKATVTSRVIIAPEHALRLLAALQDNVVRYEKEFGKIDRHEPEQEPRTIAPFGPGKVDA